jgi:hypothetical protein
MGRGEGREGALVKEPGCVPSRPGAQLTRWPREKIYRGRIGVCCGCEGRRRRRRLLLLLRRGLPPVEAPALRGRHGLEGRGRRRRRDRCGRRLAHLLAQARHFLLHEALEFVGVTHCVLRVDEAARKSSGC